MSEEQLRDVLARVVPDAPDSVADPAPVVRAARTRRRAQVALAGGAVALVGIASVVGGRALVDDDPGPQVAKEPPATIDPYSALPCPATMPDNTGLPEMKGIVGVRYCAVPFGGFPAAPGPADALVEGVGSFIDAVEALPNADPARCAAVDVLPTDSRLVLELADGSLASMPTGFCQDTTADARTVDAAGATQAFLAALRDQRDAFGYQYSGDAPALDCAAPASVSPVLPGHETLVAAVWCQPNGTAEALDGDAVATLDDGWRAAETFEEGPEQPACAPLVDGHVVALSDKGDTLQLSPCTADGLLFAGSQPGIAYLVTVPWLTELSVS